MIQLVYSSGGNVGDQQHPRFIPTKILPVISNNIREILRAEIKEKPFGITADKITTLNRTRHIFGIRLSQMGNIDSEKCAEGIYLLHSVHFSANRKRTSMPFN